MRNDPREWIAASEALPKNTTTVLVYDKRDGMRLGYYVADISGWVIAMDGERLYEVTHWMPLPPKPGHTQ